MKLNKDKIKKNNNKKIIKRNKLINKKLNQYYNMMTFDRIFKIKIKHRLINIIIFFNNINHQINNLLDFISI